MKLKFKSYVEITPIEWLYIGMLLIIVVLLVNGKTNEAMQFLKDCWKMVKK